MQINEHKQAINAAVWVTASPHEWVWKHEDQVAMARYCCWASKTLDDVRRLAECFACTIQLNSVLGGEKFVVVDVDGFIVAKGGTIEEAAAKAIAEIDADHE